MAMTRQVLVRLSLDVIEHLDAACRSTLRTRTAEIEVRLRQSMEGESFDAHGCIVKLHPAQGKALGDASEGGQ